MNSSLISSFVFGLVLIIALTLITALGVFETANLAMVDRLFQTFPNQQATPPILLVSTTDNEHNRTPVTNELLDKLEQYGPRAVYVSGRAASLVSPKKPNTFPVYSTGELRYNQSERIEPVNPADKAFATSVFIKAGYYREWQISEEVDGAVYSGFQAELSPVEMTGEIALVDFTMEDGFIPLVKASRVLDQGLAPALVKDRIILIGEAQRPGIPGFTIPLRPAQGISQLELQGYILHSALSNRFLEFSGFWVTALGVLILGLLSTLLFQWMPSHISAVFAFAMCIFIGFVQWAGVKFGTTIIPAWELIVAQLANLLAVYQLQRNREEKTLSRIIAKTNSRLTERVQPVNFNRAEDPWKKVLSLVNQQLNIKRSIFLEKVPADHRVREIEALNCSINDISERRRDYEREPYSSALEANAPVEPFRDYFEEVEEGEIQYMVPLNFGGFVLGFWALSLIPKKNWNRQAFENNVRSFATQIAELLYHRHHWHNRILRLETPWRKLMSVEAGLNLHRELNNTVDLLEHRLDILEDVLNGLSTAVIVYDVFGQVLHTNSIIEHLAQENNVAVYKLTAMELLAQSNDIPLDEARNKLRYVTLKQQTLVQSSGLFSNRGSYLLYIRPLMIKSTDSTDQVQPFQIRGILFEFADLTQIQQHDEIRQDIADQYFSQMRENLAMIGYAAEDIGTSTADNKTERLESIAVKLQQSHQLTDRVEEELKNQIHMREQTVPTNIVPIITRLIEASEEAAGGKELTFEFQPPTSDSLNFVEPKTFEQLFSALLTLLIEDATHRSVLRVSIQNPDKNTLCISLANSGGGLPQEQLEHTLASHKSYLDITDDPITQVSVLANQVPVWGGEVSLQSSIGKGYAVEITLQTFNLSLPSSANEA